MRSECRLQAISAVFACSFSLCACAQITVFSEGEAPRSEWRLGVLTIDLDGGAHNAVVQSAAIGVVSSPAGVALGYSNAKIIRIGDECRVVVVTERSAVLSADRELTKTLRQTQKACAT